MLLWLEFTFVFANIVAVLSVPLSDFYPFGIAWSDSSLPRNDDSSSPAIDLSVNFPYFDRNYRVVYVSRIITVHAIFNHLIMIGVSGGRQSLYTSRP